MYKGKEYVHYDICPTFVSVHSLFHIYFLDSVIIYYIINYILCNIFYYFCHINYIYYIQFIFQNIYFLN